MIDGQIDLAFETADGWMVVDFKTDAELAGPRTSIAARWRSTRDALGDDYRSAARGVILRI